MAALGAHLKVQISGTRVGLLERDRHGGVRFVPDSAWLEGGQHPPLGLAFLQRPNPPVVRGQLPHWFENLLPPPGSALRAWICRKQAIREPDSAALLSALGADLPGAVTVTGSLDPAEGDAVVAPVLPGEMRFSLAGLQLKLSMSLAGSRFVVPAHGETGSWIVKIPGTSFESLPEIEHATMSWARAVGLETPEFHNLAIGHLEGVDPALMGTPERAFAIRRFDREPEGRVHQEDFAQALGVPPSDIYASPRLGTSYDGLALLVRDAAGEQEQAKFIERVAFVLGSGNDDAHLKNWSFQWGAGHRPRLSPCYDMVSTLTWKLNIGWKGSTAPTLALRLGKALRFCDIGRTEVRRFARRAQATSGEERFMSTLERLRESWPAVAEQSPPTMREAVKRLWRTVPVLREVGPLEE